MDHFSTPDAKDIKHVSGCERIRTSFTRWVAVLRTAAACRICLTCTSWRRERGLEPAAPEGALAFRASALSLTRPSLRTGGSGASRTLTSRRRTRFERGGHAECPALPKQNGGDERIRTSGPGSSPGL